MKLLGDGGSGVVCTGWALLALMAAECDDTEAVKRGVAYLMNGSQRPGAAALPAALRQASRGGAEVSTEDFAIFNSFGRADLQLTTFRQPE